MKYVLVDDEKRVLNLLQILIKRYEGFSAADEIKAFTDPQKALKYLSENVTDVLFLDIEMPQFSGISLVEKIKKHCRIVPEIVFVTAFPKYSLEAWGTGALGYLLKPYDPEQLYQILNRVKKYHGTGLENIPNKKENVSLKIHMRCFPDFEMFYDRTLVSFKHKKSKELLAYLVHNHGNWVTIEKATFALLEDREENSSKNYLRTILYRLNMMLKKIGCGNLIISEYGRLRIDTEQFSCDYYDYLDGNTALFQGEYLEEYSWAEPAKAAMWSKISNKQHTK